MKLILLLLAAASAWGDKPRDPKPESKPVRCVWVNEAESYLCEMRGVILCTQTFGDETFGEPAQEVASHCVLRSPNRKIHSIVLMDANGKVIDAKGIDPQKIKPLSWKDGKLR